MSKKRKNRKGKKSRGRAGSSSAPALAPSRRHLKRQVRESAHRVDASVYSLELGRVALPLGGVALFGKAGATRKQELLEAAPIFHGLIDAAFQAHLGNGTADGGEVRASVPAAEISAVCAFLAEHTRRLELIDGLEWETMSADDQRAFYEHMGITNMLGVYQSFTTMSIIRANPERFGQVAFEVEVAPDDETST